MKNKTEMPLRIWAGTLDKEQMWVHSPDLIKLNSEHIEMGAVYVLEEDMDNVLGRWYRALDRIKELKAEIDRLQNPVDYATYTTLTEIQMQALNDLLDKPAKVNHKLKELLQSVSPWEEPDTPKCRLCDGEGEWYGNDGQAGPYKCDPCPAPPSRYTDDGYLILDEPRAEDSK